MYHTLSQVLEQVSFNTILSDRKKELEELSNYIQGKKDKAEPINLNFVCTHNSRRSQFSQIWAEVAANEYKIEINAVSSGVEVTAVNERAIASLKRFGFKVSVNGYQNPVYSIEYDIAAKSITTFSKLLEDESNPKTGFAAIMTCAHADQNCPVVPGCEVRIPIRYNDPKQYDDSPMEQTMYDYRSFEIASEMLYVFSLIK